MSEPDLLGTFEQICLWALVRVGEDAYGKTVHEEIESRTGRTVPLSQVYVCLDRLEQKRLVKSRVGGITEARGGRRKRFFEITSAGRSALATTHNALVSLSSGRRSLLDDPAGA